MISFWNDDVVPLLFTEHNIKKSVFLLSQILKGKKFYEKKNLKAIILFHFFLEDVCLCIHIDRVSIGNTKNLSKKLAEVF